MLKFGFGAVVFFCILLWTLVSFKPYIPDDEDIKLEHFYHLQEGLPDAPFLWPNFVNLVPCRRGSRQASLPLVTGDGFRCLADVYLDETNNYAVSDLQLKQLHTISKHRVPVVFIKSNAIYLDGILFFDEWHARFDQRYIIVTHNSDYGMPGLGRSLLDDPRVVHWFAINTEDPPHPKLTTIPLGWENAWWDRMHAQDYLQARPQIILAKNKNNATSLGPEEQWLVLNFTPRNEDRQEAIDHFGEIPWAVIEPMEENPYEIGDRPRREFHQQCFWQNIVHRYRFALSPVGNGLDCIRTYEMLLGGVIPIVRDNSLRTLWHHLPEVLVVDQWEDVTLDLLQSHWEEHGHFDPNTIPPGLTMRYWMDKVWNVSISS